MIFVLLSAAVVAELLWLVGANIFLSRESTQAWLSGLRPERVQMSWDSAWSWYPGRVSVRGAEVSGQTPKFQWQADAQSVVGNVALLPLLQKKVVISRVRVSGGDYRQRPRLNPDGSNQEVSQWFAPIRDYELTPEGQRRIPRRKPWTVIVDNARLSGDYTTWVHRFRAEFHASTEVDVKVRAQGGPLKVQIEGFNAELKRLWADENRTIFNGGTVSGDLDLGPYRYTENRGARALRYLDTNLNLDLNSDSLSFINLFLLRYPTVQIDGQGEANGALVISKGSVADGTTVEVKAGDLVITQPPFRASGEGSVSLKGRSDAKRPFLIAMQLENIGIFHADDQAPFVSGDTLLIQLEDEGDLLPRKLMDSPKPHDFVAQVDVPSARVDDSTSFNKFLPEQSPIQFTGGQTDVTVRLTLSPDHAEGEVKLEGEELTARMEQQELGLDLRFDGVIEGGTPLDRKFDIAGSNIQLTSARVIGEETTLDAENWSATANITEGTIDFQDTLDMAFAANLTVSDSRPLSALFINNGGPKWIGKRLSADNLNGDVRLRVTDRKLYVPEAQLAAEELEVAVKGTIAKPANQGMVYLRYKRLDALLNFENGDRKIVLIGPLKKFEAYSVSLPPPAR